MGTFERKDKKEFPSHKDELKKKEGGQYTGDKDKEKGKPETIEKHKGGCGSC